MLLTKFFNKPEKVISARGFFDYSASDKKKILSGAARRADEAQLALVKEYHRKFGDK